MRTLRIVSYNILDGGGGNDLGVRVGRNDDPPARVADACHISGIEHGSGADQHPVAEVAGEGLDALERFGGIERYLDAAEARLYEGLARRLRKFRLKASENGDEREVVEIVPQDLGHGMQRR